MLGLSFGDDASLTPRPRIFNKVHTIELSALVNHVTARVRQLRNSGCEGQRVHLDEFRADGKNPSEIQSWERGKEALNPPEQQGL